MANPGGLAGAIQSELQRRSKKGAAPKAPPPPPPPMPTNGTLNNNSNSSDSGSNNTRAFGDTMMIKKKSGPLVALATLKNDKHDALMAEFRRAHKKMFRYGCHKMT